jgi:phage-related protein
MATAWKVTFFSNKVKAETFAFPDSILADLLHILELVEQHGPNLGKPHTAPMGVGLFEIRAKGREGIARSLFCTVAGQEVVILNSFIKKTQKTPPREIDKARKRMKELHNA